MLSAESEVGMKRYHLGVAVLFAAAYLTPAAATAQEYKPAPAEPLSLKSQRFRTDQPGYCPLSAANCGMTFYDTYFRRLDSWKQEEGARRVISVSAASCLEGESVHITVKLHRGERFYESDELVDSFRLRAGEEYTVEKLRQHGIEPYVFAVVKRLRAGAAPPRVENLTQSIQVEDVRVDEEAAALRIRLRDVSGRMPMAVQLEVRRGRESLGFMPRLGERGRPVINTGQTVEIKYALGAVADPKGASVTQVPDTLVVESALFADGGYEGKPGPAATAAAQIEGFNLQLARIVPLLDEAFAWPAAETRAAAARLLSRVEALDTKADPAAVEELRRRFAGLPAEQLELLGGNVEWGMHHMRGELLAELRSLSASPDARLPSFADWLRAKHESFAERLARR